MTHDELLRALLVERYTPLPESPYGACRRGPTAQWQLADLQVIGDDEDVPQVAGDGEGRKPHRDNNGVAAAGGENHRDAAASSGSTRLMSRDAGRAADYRPATLRAVS